MSKSYLHGGFIVTLLLVGGGAWLINSNDSGSTWNTVGWVLVGLGALDFGAEALVGKSIASAAGLS